MRIAVLLPVLLLISVAVAQPAKQQGEPCNGCGVITSIQMTTQEEQWTPVGLVAAGSGVTQPTGTEARSAFEFGSEGSRGMVIIGAAGGAVYSRQPGSYQRPRWRVTVKMDEGGTRVLQQRYEPFVQEGDHVRVMGTQVELVD